MVSHCVTAEVNHRSEFSVRCGAAAEYRLADGRGGRREAIRSLQSSLMEVKSGWLQQLACKTTMPTFNTLQLTHWKSSVVWSHEQQQQTKLEEPLYLVSCRVSMGLQVYVFSVCYLIPLSGTFSCRLAALLNSFIQTQLHSCIFKPSRQDSLTQCSWCDRIHRERKWRKTEVEYMR